MVGDSSSRSRRLHGERASFTSVNRTSRMNQLKKQIQAERAASVQERLEANRSIAEDHVSKFLSAARSRTDVSGVEKSGSGQMLSSRLENPPCQFSGFAQGLGERDNIIQEVAIAPSAMLPYIEKIPRYITWTFYERNQKMTEDQSVIGKRRIYYDPHSCEALICSESEEEIVEPEEEKYEFSEAEERILRMFIQEHEFSKEVLDFVSQFVGGTPSEIKDHYNMLKEKDQEEEDHGFKESGETGLDGSIFPGKSLSAALDSFDNLFCRRCLVFDCRLHGCSQSLINPSERQSYSSESDEDGRPCSDQCYLRLKVAKDFPKGSAIGASCSALDRIATKTSEEEDNNPVPPDAEQQASLYDSMGKRTHIMTKDSILVSEDSSSKKQKKSSELTAVTLTSKGVVGRDRSFSAESLDPEVGEPDRGHLHLTTNDAGDISTDHPSDKFSASLSVARVEVESSIGDEVDGTSHAGVLVPKQSSSSVGGQDKKVFSSSKWKPLEKELYLKGIEIFGRNSCLIARNLLSGLKTCAEVSNYMYKDGAALPHGSTDAQNALLEDNGKDDPDYIEQEARARPRLFRRRGRTKKLKYSWKSAGHPSSWKRIADGKNQPCKQCSKSCKNRFRGCHCAKSQCRSRQCPCFAAGRECDPDVCRNCWVSCGDGSLGEPPRKGEGQCGNMRLLLRQQQRILLGKSDVAGWGAFLKNPVNKNDYLGEYTGELISHREADKRGKMYDRANSSFLFDLNDQYVLDAYRKGDKLKFANHSSNPNCYAKVMFVAGDHRVGIFAKEHIEASEELFYDYRYEPDQAPEWARKPESSKGDGSSSNPHARARKHQSN